MIRRRPIPRFKYFPQASLRYDTILDGAVRVYRDCHGEVVREVCQNSKAGWLEYNRRVKAMVERQGRRCCLCNRPLALGNATFLSTNGVEEWEQPSGTTESRKKTAIGSTERPTGFVMWRKGEQPYSFLAHFAQANFPPFFFHFHLHDKARIVAFNDALGPTEFVAFLVATLVGPPTELEDGEDQDGNGD